jgi:ferrous iron transport protein A
MKMPLTFLSVGQEGLVQRVSGRDEVRRLLESMGFVAGEKVTLVSHHGGNYILGVRGTRVALDRSMACRVIVA